MRAALSPPSGPTRHDPAATEPLWPTQPILTTEPEEIIADFRTFYYETALSGFETNLVALENFVESDHILFGTDFPAVSPQTAGWYTNNVDTYFQARPDLLTQVMHGNAHSLLPRLATTRAN
jgi:predicted TIM-barrel fold metal-dependent hydrolase